MSSWILSIVKIKVQKNDMFNFDDSIKSQAHVALEVLDDLKMKAFFC